MNKIIGLAVIVSTCTQLAWASGSSNNRHKSEIDSFHGRYTELADATDALNKKTKELFQDALKRANEKQEKKGKSCSKKILYKSMRKNFRNHYLGKLNPWIIKTDKIDKVVVSVENSIYQDFKWYEAYVPGLFARTFKDPSAMLLRVKDVKLGNDKFEHFLGSGFNYFKKHYLKKESLREALIIGWKAETGLLGAATTGVMSYADMVANFNGMRFWNHLLAENEDVFGPEEKFNPGPYVVCKDHKWVQVKDMDWSYYIDHAFDEGINCSKFKNKEMTETVISRIAAIEMKEDRNYQCPILPLELDKMVEKYKPFKSFLINTEGHIPMPDDKKAPKLDL